MTKEIRGVETKTKLAATIAKLIGELSQIHLKEPKKHPWEVYLSGLSKKERRVSRMACEVLPDMSVEELIEKLQLAVSNILSQDENFIYIDGITKKVNETIITQGNETHDTNSSPTIYLSPTLTSEEVLIDFLVNSKDSCWMSIGIVEKQGKKFLFSSGDHLAADGNIFMKIFSAIKQEIDGSEPINFESRIDYSDREKNIYTHCFSHADQVFYQSIYENIITAFIEETHKKGDLSVIFPVQEEVAGHVRMLPVQIPVNIVGKSSSNLQEQLKQAIKNPNKLDSPHIRWIRLLNEPKGSFTHLYRLLHSSTLGEEADRYFKGDILFSVMEAQVPISSTTIVPHEKTLVCTLVRHPETKRVLSLSISGNKQYWDMQRLKNLTEIIVQNLH